MTKTLVALMCFSAFSCAAPRVDMSGAWPEKPGSYRATHRAWTRHKALRHGVDTVLEAYVTLKSAQWRAAYVAEQRKRARLTDSDGDALVKEQRAESDKAWEIVLVVATHHRRYNDFHKKERSIWKVRLIGKEGRWVAPQSVRQDKRPDVLLQYWFPDAQAFYETYVFIFPKQTADGQELAPPGEGLALRIGSALGNVELSWSSK